MLDIFLYCMYLSIYYNYIGHSYGKHCQKSITYLSKSVGNVIYLKYLDLHIDRLVQVTNTVKHIYQNVNIISVWSWKCSFLHEPSDMLMCRSVKNFIQANIG